MARHRHWLWYAYLALADRGGLTEAEGRELLKSTFPNFADVVDPVVAAFGDPSKLSEKLQQRSDDMAETEEAALQSAEMNGQIREIVNRQRQANNQPRDGQGRFLPESQNSTESESEGAAAAGDMNSLLRQAAHRGRISQGDDVRTAMRRLGRQTVEVE